MPDDRTKYQVQIALKNGQAFTLVTHMNDAAIRDELNNAREQDREARFNGINPADDSDVILYVDPKEVAGRIVAKWYRPIPQAQPVRPSIVQ